MSQKLLPKLHLQMRMKSKAQHTNLTGMKRNVELESEAKLSKVKSPSKKSKVLLKGELILELKDFSFLSEIWKLKIQC